MKKLSNQISYYGNTEGLINAMLNNPDIAFIIIDTKGVIKTFSKGAENLTGYKCSEVIDIYTPVIFFKKTLVSTDVSVENILSGIVFKSFIASALSSTSQGVERTLFKKNEGIVPCSLYVEILRNADGENNGYLMTLTQISNTVDSSEKMKQGMEGNQYSAGAIVHPVDFQKKDQLAPEQYMLNILMDNIPDHIYFKDKESKFLRISNSLAKWLGIEDPFEVIGYSDFDFFSKKHAEKAFNDEQEIMRTGEALLNIIEKEVWPDGRETWVSTSKMPFYDTNGSIIGTFGISKNITSQKLAENALINNEKRFRSLVQNSTDIITILDANGTIKYESPSFYRIFGYKEEDVLEKNALDFIHPEDLKDIIEPFNMLKEATEIITIADFRFKDVYGNWIYLESKGYNLLHDDTIHGFVINSRDITDQRNTEVKIREKSQILNGILANMPVIVYRIDKNGIFTESLGAGLKRLGVKENQVVGENAYDLYPQLKEQIDTGLKNGYLEYVHTFVNDDQKMFYKNFLFEDQSSAGGYIGFVLDITESKVAEQTLKEYSITLERANKDLDQLTYVVSHDLKAPLRAIFNLSQWIEEDIKDQLSEENKRNMELLRGRVSRMEGLINALAEYSKIGKKEMLTIPVNVKNLLEEIITSLSPPTHVEIRIHLGMPSFSTKRLRLKQTFYHLIDNAIKHNDKEVGIIDITCTELDEFYQFSITDNGPGVAPEYHERIFKIFQRLEARDKVEGIGIGLTMVKKILEEQGGKIWIEPAQGEGIKFTFCWPKAKQEKIQGKS